MNIFSKAVAICTARKAHGVRILYVADARSPIFLNWLSYYAQTSEHDLHLVSTYEATGLDYALSSHHYLPVAFSSLADTQKAENQTPGQISRLAKGTLFREVVARTRNIVSPLSVCFRSSTFRNLVSDIDPDLVHAMRLPYEGFLAAEGLRGTRHALLLSTWGNDFTLKAAKSRVVSAMTHRALRRADAIHTDCHRDLRLAHRWSYDFAKPAIVAPGNGGIHLDVFFPDQQESKKALEHKALIVNPRGPRRYVRNDTFFKAASVLSEDNPNVRFLALGMDGYSPALSWTRKLDLERSVKLLGHLSSQEMAEVFRGSAISVSLAEHDGTPNTLLEAMACGAFPIAGDIPSIREWINHGINGFLVDPSNPVEVADAMRKALGDTELREKAAKYNWKLIRHRADHRRVMPMMTNFYKKVAEETRSRRS